MTCRGCGLPVDVSFDPGNEDAFTVRKLVCHACAARDRRAAGASHTHGVYYRVERA